MSTLDEIRELNLARNQDFWKRLQGDEDKLIALIDDHESAQPIELNEQHKSGVEEEIGEDVGAVTMLESLIKKAQSYFVGRNVEIAKLMRLLYKVRVLPQPSILMSGPSGSGKKSIVQKCIEIAANGNNQDVSVVICCKGFTDKKAFYHHFWDQITIALAKKLHALIASIKRRRFNSQNSRIKRMASSNNGNSSSSAAALTGATQLHWVNDLLSKKPNSFSDVCLQLPSLLSTYTSVRGKLESLEASFSRPDKCNTPIAARVLLLLQSVDDLDALDAGMAAKLVLLPEITMTAITVLATTVVPPSVCLPSVHRKLVLLHFPSYSDAQLTLIVKTKLLACLAAESDHGNRECDDADADSLEAIKEATLADVSHILSAHLPKLLSTSRHPDYLLSSLRILLSKSRSSSGGPPMLAVGSTKELDTLAGRLATKTLFALQPLVSASTAMASGTTCPLRYDHLPIASTYLIDAIAVVANDEIDWMVKDWPIAMKILVVALYIAGVNPKESDVYTFGTDLRGRRKKPRRGADHSKGAQGKRIKKGGEGEDQCDSDADKDSNAADTSNKGGKSQQTRHQMTATTGGPTGLREFTIERVFSIFGQVLLHCRDSSSSSSSYNSIGHRAAVALGKRLGLKFITAELTSIEVSKLFGDGELFAMVQTLEDRRLISRTSSSSISMPSYFSHIDSTLAEAIARELSFPLSDFVFTQ